MDGPSRATSDWNEKLPPYVTQSDYDTQKVQHLLLNALQVFCRQKTETKKTCKSGPREAVIKEVLGERFTTCGPVGL